MFLDKLRNGLIFFTCLAYAVCRGRADRKIEPLKKILIIQTAKIGDLVCTTPMFKAVKDRYPQSQLFVLGSKINQELIQGLKLVDNYLVLPNYFLKLVKRIKKENFDFACVTTPNFMALAAMYLAGVRLIAVPKIENGQSPYETKTYKYLSRLVITKPHRMGEYAPREYLRLLEPIEIFTDKTKKYLTYSTAAEDKVARFFKANNIDLPKDFVVGLAPSTGNKIKLWPAERFAGLITNLCHKYQPKILILGGKDDQSEIEKVLSYLDKASPVIDCGNLFTLEELKALIAKLKLFISVDSGPIYIAEAFGVPTVDIIGPMNEKEQPPSGKIHRIVKLPNRQKPAIAIMNARVYDKQEARRQIEEITVPMVLNQIDDLINSLKLLLLSDF